MKTILAVLVALAGLFYATPAFNQQACTQTFSSTSGLVSAVSSAANGSVICLNNGSYGTVDFYDITGRSGYVTVRSTSGRGASITPRPGNSRYLRFRELTIPGGVVVNSCSQNIQFVDNTFSSGSGTLYFNAETCQSTTVNYLADGNTFINSPTSGNEGRLGLRHVKGATITNNLFQGIGGTPSDGVYIDNGEDVTVGPNNVFTGILQSSCGGTHCDNLQIAGAGPNIRITGNYFENGATFIMAPDGSSGVTVSDNVFNGSSDANDWKIQFGSASNLTFEHNTMYRAGVAVDSKTGQSASSNAMVRNNISHTGSGYKTSNGNGCSSCTFVYNRIVGGAALDQTNCSSCTINNNATSGTPTYVGGSPPPSTWAGWRLAGGSSGENAGNDGKNQGALYFSPAPPTNFQGN